MADKTCFIIMPITTPEPYLEMYRDGANHFEHVLQCLFITSIEKAGYKPIPPIAKEADLIQAEIIKNLEQSDLVLCDMSCLNPNVFFEFGIRTSLNKSVCVVKDEHTRRVPFDTGILNLLEYRSMLEHRELSGQIEKLTEHIRMSHQRSKGGNSLWKYFGLRSEARAYEGETGSDAEQDYLAMQMDSLRQQVSTLDQKVLLLTKKENRNLIRNDILVRTAKSCPHTASLVQADYNQEGDLVLTYRGIWPEEDKSKLKRYASENFGIRLDFRTIPDSDEKSKQQEI
jgi:hypothetical protein